MEHKDALNIFLYTTIDNIPFSSGRNRNPIFNLVRRVLVLWCMLDLLSG